MTGRKSCALQVPPVVPYKALGNFSKALYGTTRGTCSTRFFRSVMVLLSLKRRVQKRPNFVRTTTSLGPGALFLLNHWSRNPRDLCYMYSVNMVFYNRKHSTMYSAMYLLWCLQACFWSHVISLKTAEQPSSALGVFLLHRLTYSQITQNKVLIYSVCLAINFSHSFV